MEWDNAVLAIPKDADYHEGEVDNFFRQYGKLSMEHLQAVASLYIATQTRFAKDSMQLHKCLHDSLSKISRNKVTLHHKQCTVGGHPVRLLLLKVIIQESHM